MWTGFENMRSHDRTRPGGKTGHGSGERGLVRSVRGTCPLSCEGRADVDPEAFNTAATPDRRVPSCLKAWARQNRLHEAMRGTAQVPPAAWRPGLATWTWAAGLPAGGNAPALLRQATRPT